MMNWLKRLFRREGIKPRKVKGAETPPRCDKCGRVLYYWRIGRSPQIEYNALEDVLDMTCDCCGYTWREPAKDRITVDKTIVSVMLLSIMLMLGALCWQIGDIDDGLNELSSVTECNETINTMPLGEWIDATPYQVRDIIFTSDSNPDAFKATGLTMGADHDNHYLKNTLRGKSMDSS